MLGLMTLGMVILTVGCGFWWYFSDSDLEAVREQARLQGRPLSWSDMGLKPADPERLRMWKRVTELTAQLKSYQPIVGVPRKAGPVFKLWDPIPQEMRDFHQALDGAAITELIELLDRLGDQPLVLQDYLTYETEQPEINETRNLINFLQERMLLAESADTAAWGKRLLATCRRFSADSVLQHMVRNSFIGVTLGIISFRLADLKQAEPNIAIDILHTTQSTHTNLPHALDGEFIIMMDMLSRRINYLNKGDRWMQMIFRAGRQGSLFSALDDRHELQSIDDQRSVAWAKSAEVNFRTAQKGVLYLANFPPPSIIIQGLLTPNWMVIRICSVTALRGRLIAAELQGQPWPIDTFDATGALLRPITRDGRVIAAYSVGDDGIDQGGNEKKDHVFPLYAKP
jgi:hypothetical protein